VNSTTLERITKDLDLFAKEITGESNIVSVNDGIGHGAVLDVFDEYLLEHNVQPD
jgi:hypothetical protein